MRKTLISCLWSSGSCTAHSIKISIEKSIDFLVLELWKPHLISKIFPLIGGSIGGPEVQ